VGTLEWTEEQFWNSTLRGFGAAVRGYNERKNPRKQKFVEDDEDVRSLLDTYKKAPETVKSLSPMRVPSAYRKQFEDEDEVTRG
jgi:hypothetical protein